MTERQRETEEEVQGHREREAKREGPKKAETGDDGKTQEQKGRETHADMAAEST